MSFHVFSLFGSSGGSKGRLTKAVAVGEDVSGHSGPKFAPLFGDRAVGKSKSFKRTQLLWNSFGSSDRQDLHHAVAGEQSGSQSREKLACGKRRHVAGVMDSVTEKLMFDEPLTR